MRLSDLREYFALKPILKEPWRFIRTWREPLGRDDATIELRTGPSIRVRGNTTDRRIFHTIFARDEYRLNDVAPGSWDTIIDIGAHIGFFARRAAPLAKRVICFEPVEANFSLLRINMDHPPFAHVKVHPVAIAEKEGPLEFFFSPTDPSSHTMLPGKEGCVMPMRVEATTLDRVFRENSVETCDLLKLDCEGGEYSILRSTPAELWPKIRRIRMEFHRGPEGWDAPKLAAFLTERGYRCEVVPRRTHPDRGLMFAVRQTA